MPDPTVSAFTADHVAAAGRLLAERHRRQRVAEPLLSPRFEDPAVAAESVREAWSVEGASGVVATLGDEVLGYLVGAPKADSWGPNVWVESAGVAAPAAETARQMYAGAAQRWVDEGRTAHYVMVPAQDAPLVEAFFRCAFGHQQTHAVLELPSAPPAVPDHLTARPARRDDIASLVPLDLALPVAHLSSPTFAGIGMPDEAELAAEWEKDVDDPTFAHLVVEHDGVVVAAASGCDVGKSSTHRGPAAPDGGWLLGFAAVLPEARGLGAGRAVAEAVAWAGAERGASCVVTDWREPNLLSSRAWRGIGYRDTFLRLHRLVRY